jgi:hypothetical protein
MASAGRKGVGLRKRRTIGLGARLLAPETRTVIDIGGQDSKVIQLDAQGNLSDFLMNDKCAAGTGRFLEVISRTLGASVDQLDAITEGVEPHAITSMCTVFAESEVISLRSAGVAPEAILAGGAAPIAPANWASGWVATGMPTCFSSMRAKAAQWLTPPVNSTRMSKYLFLFHSTAGVVRMRKALQAAGMTFEVKDRDGSRPACQHASPAGGRRRRSG